MAHFAQIVSNIVVQVLVVPDEVADRGQDYLANELQLGGTWIQTSYNTKAGVHLYGGEPLRKNYAGIGYTYDTVRDAFIPPNTELTASWILDEDSCTWKPPFPAPDDGKIYRWNESIVNWEEYIFPGNIQPA